MNNEHLSEEQLQDYAMGIRTNTTHVATCPHCQQQIKAYQLLFEAIREEADPIIAFDRAACLPKSHYLTRLLTGALSILLVVIVAGCCWLLSGIATVIIVFGLLLLFGIVAMQVMEIYHTYSKNNL